MLYLVDESCIRQRLERQVPVVKNRLRQMQQVESATWFEEIRSEAESGKFERHGSVAVVRITGALGYRYDIWAWLFDDSCYIGIANAVTAALNDAQIKKIVLYVDSPGGTFSGNQECANAIWTARQSKEVVAVVDPLAASAGYWLASQASRIVILESGWCGSIGSMMRLQSLFRLYDEAGIDNELIRSVISPKKNLGWSYEPISDEARADMQRMTDYAGNLFVQHVERGRGKTRKEILDRFGQGLMYFGPEAVERGMVDAIGGLQDELETTPVSQQDMPSSKNGKSRRMASSFDLYRM